MPLIASAQGVAETSAAAAAPLGAAGEMPRGRAEHLMVLPVPLRVVNGRILFEQQACNGVARWADHFHSLIVAAPTLPEQLVGQMKAMAWRDADEIEHRERIEFVPLPWGFSPREHFRHARATRRLLRQLIDRSDYLHFGIGALLGDWAAEAAQIALDLGRPYAVHMDRVEHEHILRTAAGKPLLKRTKARAYAALMQRWHRKLIAGAALSMCHGYDTYAAYRELNKHSYVVHNIHTTAADQATGEQVEAKVARVLAGGPINVVYAGRLDPEKAPLDWVRAVARAVEKGADLRATWLGDGKLREAALVEAKRLGLGEVARFPGFSSDRAAVLGAIRDTDVLLFTHVTPESPRVLIEALNGATPIVGYESHYPVDLIAEHRGGVLTPTGAPVALGDALAELASDRPRLARLIRAAGADGKKFTTEAVFKHRSELLREHLPRPHNQIA
jgi:glycosyltransferase involved in cell wall biosynthesis